MPSYAESGTFTSMQGATQINVYRAVLRRLVPYQDTTGSASTSATGRELTVSGLDIWSGTFNGWMVSGATSHNTRSNTGIWRKDKGELTLTITNGINVTCTTTVVRSITSNLDYGASNRGVIPMVCRFDMQGAVTFA